MTTPHPRAHIILCGLKSPWIRAKRTQALNGEEQSPSHIMFTTDINNNLIPNWGSTAKCHRDWVFYSSAYLIHNTNYKYTTLTKHNNDIEKIATKHGFGVCKPGHHEGGEKQFNGNTYSGLFDTISIAIDEIIQNLNEMEPGSNWQYTNKSDSDSKTQERLANLDSRLL